MKHNWLDLPAFSAVRRHWIHKTPTGTESMGVLLLMLKMEKTTTRKHLFHGLLSVMTKWGQNIVNGLWFKFLAVAVKQDDSGPLQLYCLCSDEAERGVTLGICDEYRQIMENVMSMMTTLTYHHLPYCSVPLQHPSHLCWATITV